MELPLRASRPAGQLLLAPLPRLLSLLRHRGRGSKSTRPYTSRPRRPRLEGRRCSGTSRSLNSELTGFGGSSRPPRLPAGTCAG
eukprot:15415139-Alexandrium_andersonii.AAC.1